MKVFLSYDITNNPCGGGNQFLRNLGDFLLSSSLLTNKPREADLILYNGHHKIEQTLQIKKRFPEKIFIHRMDGLQKLYNSENDSRQDISIQFNKISSGTIFQSNWAKLKFKEYGFEPENSTVIPNAANPELFNTNHPKEKCKKTRLLCTSFSPNINKGFKFYETLDKELNFKKFNFIFIGNKPADIEYKNIKCLPPKSTVEISEYLKTTDIFVSATVNDCCSNSIIEALSCGVPVLGKNSGGNPELVKEGGLCFDSINDFKQKLDLISKDVDFFRKKITINNAEDIFLKYISFFKKCIN